MTSQSTDEAPPPVRPTPNPLLMAAREQLPERSQQIVAAAYELLEEEGLEGLTIRAVLKRTGLSRRAVYERFAGKDDLVLAVFAEIIGLAASHYAQEVQDLPDPLQRLELIVTSIVMGRSALATRFGEHSDRLGAAMSREHLRLAESRPTDLQTALSPLINLISNQLSQGMAAGVVRTYDPYRLAALVYNLVSTTVHTELLAQGNAGPDRQRRTELAREIWEFCRGAIAA